MPRRLTTLAGRTPYGRVLFMLDRAHRLYKRYQDLSPRDRRRLADQAREVRDCAGALRRARGRDQRVARAKELGTALAELRRRLPPPRR